MKTALVALAAATLLGTLASSRVASATPPDPALLEKLAHNEQEIEATAKRATYHAEEVVEQLDGDGKVASTKTSHYHVELDGTTRRLPPASSTIIFSAARSHSDTSGSAETSTAPSATSMWDQKSP